MLYSKQSNVYMLASVVCFGSLTAFSAACGFGGKRPDVAFFDQLLRATQIVRGVFSQKQHFYPIYSTKNNSTSPK